MLYQVLWRNQPLWQVFGACAGAFLGVTLLVLAWETHKSFQDYLKAQDELFPPRYLTLAHKVSLMSNLPGFKPLFKEAEIEELRNTPGVEDITAFTTANFQAEVIFKVGAFKAYRTELFLEALPPRFLENPPENWEWEPGDAHLPALLPNSFLQLYNFGFAPANGYPQVSKGAIGKVPLTLMIPGKGGRPMTIQARISSFSDRITTILVPQSFLNWANDLQPPSKARKDVHRVLLKAQTPIQPELSAKLDTYETNRELLGESKANQLLQFALGTTGSIGLVLLLVAFLAYWLSFQMILHRSTTHLRTLLYIGYRPSTLFQHYLKILLAISTALLVCSTIAACRAQDYSSDLISRLGLDLATPIWSQTLVHAAIPILILTLAQAFTIRSALYKLARS